MDSGRLVYDPAAAERLFQSLRDPDASCREAAAAYGFDSYDAHSFGGTFRGVLPPGSACDAADSKKFVGFSPCEEGSLCLPDATGANRCQRLAAPGEACPVFADRPDSTCMERRPSDNDGEYESAFSGLSCVPDAPGSRTGTCLADAPDGSACTHDAQCANRRCLRDFAGSGVGACASRLAHGEACSVASDCASGRCASLSGTAVCAELLAVGEVCESSSDCDSGTCVDAFTDLPRYVCAPRPEPLPLGATCRPEDACAQGSCEDGRCVARICGDFDASPAAD